MSLGDYRRRWQELHRAPDVDPTRGSLAVYTAAMHRLAVPFARRRVHPNAVSMLAVLLGVGVPVAASRGARWPLAAAVLCICSGLADGVDGAVAAMTDTATRNGAVIDSVGDRVCDLCLVGAMAVLGGQRTLAVAVGAAVMGLEYTRARAGAVGLEEVGAVTIAERPTRLIAAALCCAAYGITTSNSGWIATASLVVLLVLTLVGWIQLWWWLIRHFR
jgi:phosphatidylglycerophosphate synthase